MSLKKACLIVKATNSRVGSFWLPTLVGWFLLKVREEFCHQGLQSANNKGTDQLAHPRSLISAFAIYKLNSIAFKLAPSENSIFYLVSVAEKAGFGMILSETLKTGFVASMLIYAFIFM